MRDEEKERKKKERNKAKILCYIESEDTDFIVLFTAVNLYVKCFVSRRTFSIPHFNVIACNFPLGSLVTNISRTGPDGDSIINLRK